MTAPPPPEVIEVAKAWAVSRGDLRPLMTRTQRIVYALWTAQRYAVFFLDCSRRWGKTRFLVMAMFVQAWALAGSIIRYCAPTKLHGRTFVIPAVEWLSALVPQHMRPTFDRQDNVWMWPNGSRCYLGSGETIADCDAQVGTECHLAICDEGAKMRSACLEHWHKTVIVPQFLTTRGRLLVGSTPAIIPAHYLTTLRRRAREAGACVTFTINDCDHISQEMKDEAIAECGGIDTPEARRELFCDNAPDPTWLIIPEWQKVRAECIAEVPRPEFIDWYAAADFAFEDLSAVLYGWFDFPNQRIVVEYEVVRHRAGSIEVGGACRDLEEQHGIVPLARVADAPLQQLADLMNSTTGPGVLFSATQKDDADAVLAHLRAEVGRKRIVVHPRCVTLIEHLDNAIWNTNRSSFERVDGFGHWDLIDALKYLNRKVDRRRNPEPIIHPSIDQHSHFVHPSLLALQRTRGVKVLGKVR